MNQLRDLPLLASAVIFSQLASHARIVHRLAVVLQVCYPYIPYYFLPQYKPTIFILHKSTLMSRAGFAIAPFTCVYLLPASIQAHHTCI